QTHPPDSQRLQLVVAFTAQGKVDGRHEPVDKVYLRLSAWISVSARLAESSGLRSIAWAITSSGTLAAGIWTTLSVYAYCASQKAWAEINTPTTTANIHCSRLLNNRFLRLRLRRDSIVSMSLLFGFDLLTMPEKLRAIVSGSVLPVEQKWAPL